ncbi:hypothetical protein LTR84_004126 [Exophiala bonariae]|uniref:Mid2 domain-containing protein n=1 Tax=Exophiala bonariae TaxID=1690606 RepID=A0AAV9N5F1_9EURO|nr:hypothetical protein LTR84_004126 [Exophiala bonariae]
MRCQSWAFVASLLYSRHAYALSNITYYSDTQCTELLDEKTGPDDGTCTQFPTLTKSFGSFRVESLDQTCSVSVYGSDTAFCSSTINLYVATFGDCLNDTTVNQFSVDCQDYSAAISSPPNVFIPTNTTTTSDDTSEGLSAGAKAGIGIAAAAFVVLLVAGIVYFVIRNNRLKRKNMPHTGFAEADGNPAAPPYSELPPDSEKKRPVELPPQHMIPVEVAGDHSWPSRELDGTAVQSQIKASALAAAKGKPLSKRPSHSDVTPLSNSDNGASTIASTSFSPVSPDDTR